MNNKDIYNIDEAIICEDKVLKSEEEFTEILRNFGVSMKNIEYIKNTKPLNLIEEYKSYEVCERKKNEIVETKLIVCPSYSYVINPCSFKYFNNSYFDNGRIYSGCLKEPSMQNFISNINARSKLLYDSCKSSDEESNVDLFYFEDKNLYMVGIDGNHRVLYALIVGIEEIKANVTVYRKKTK